MQTQIFKVKAVGQTTVFTSQKPEVGQQERRQIVLQALGGDYEDSFSATQFGIGARQPIAAGDLVAARLQMLTHDYQGQTYQDCVAREIICLTPALSKGEGDATPKSN